MIISGILSVIKTLLIGIISVFNMPSVSEEFYNAFDLINDWLANGQHIIDLFVPWNIVKFGIPLIVFVVNFEHIYGVVMWILRKIPMLGID